jgi:hypothetical protein
MSRSFSMVTQKNSYIVAIHDTKFIHFLILQIRDNCIEKTGEVTIMSF